MSMMQKRKGRLGEQELARLLRDELGDQVTRNLQQSREGGADLEGTPFVLEVKRAKTPKVLEWWRQACAQAQTANGVPALVYRIDHKEWMAVLPLGAVHPGFYDTMDFGLTVVMGLREFCAVIRETAIQTQQYDEGAGKDEN